jgi:RNA polymerase sigma factor for flagellar operon FliA
MTGPPDSPLPPYAGIRLADVRLVRSAADARAAVAALLASDAIGFDTESKPTFARGEVSSGPHLIQFASDDHAYLFPVTGTPESDSLRAILESPQPLKVGFGLGDDLRRLQGKLGIHAMGIIDLAVALREERSRDVGARRAVERFFGRRLQKSKRTSTSNWAAANLTERQLLYAANDAQVALRVYRAWLRGGAHPPGCVA